MKLQGKKSQPSSWTPAKCHLHSDAERGTDTSPVGVTHWQMAMSAGIEQVRKQRSCILQPCTQQWGLWICLLGPVLTNGAEPRCAQHPPGVCLSLCNSTTEPNHSPSTKLEGAWQCFSSFSSPSFIFFPFLFPACDSSRHLSNECEGIYTGQSEMYEADRLHLITANGSPRR